MLPFNPEFQTNTSKITEVRLSILLQSGGLLNLTEENVLLGGFTRDSSTTIDGQFTVGAAVTGKITAIIDNSDNTLSTYDFRGAVITASLGGTLSDQTHQLVQVGIYTVDEYSYDGSNITLTAYDNLHKFDVPCINTDITFPRTIKQLIDQACQIAGVSLANQTIPAGEFVIEKQPKQWDTMTWHDVIAYCAQIACCFVKVLPDGRLFFSWYDSCISNVAYLDGGSFDTNTTPYSDGDTADGGDFTYTDTNIIDGGTFGDRDECHVLGSIFDMSVDTDDVLITGVSVSLDPTNNINATDGTKEYIKTIGTTEYAVRIENNPLIETTTAANSICQYLQQFLIGMRFRPLHASVLESPSCEAGDAALLVDRYNNTHTCFLSHVTYTTGSATSVSCDAESTMQNLRSRYTEGQKTRALAQRTFDIAIRDAEQAMQTIMSAVATTMGLYLYTESDGQGGTIYTFGNKPTLAESNIRWRFSAGALMVSSDYGATWNGALTSDGIAVLQEIYAVKVNADNILAGHLSADYIQGGTLTLGGNNNTNGTLVIKNASGTQIGKWDNDGINVSSGSITGGTISGTMISGNTISGGTVSGTAISGGTISGTSISGGTVSGATISGGKFISTNDSNFQITIENAWITAKYANSSYNFYELNPNGLLFYEYAKNCTWISNNSIILYREDGSTIGVYLFRNSAGTCTIETDNLYVKSGGTKSKVVDTNYGKKLAYCYEMPSPMYGDLGSATIGDDGSVVVDIDPIFVDYIYSTGEYYVFLQNEGDGKSYISEKQKSYFVISGTPGLKVVWELKARQSDLYWLREEDFYENDVYDESETDYEAQAFADVMKYLNMEEIT